MGHAHFLVDVELTWVQNLGYFSKSSRRLPTNTLHISYRTIAQKHIIAHVCFLGKSSKQHTLIFFTIN